MRLKRIDLAEIALNCE